MTPSRRPASPLTRDATLELTPRSRGIGPSLSLGRGGQKFKPECLPKVTELRARFPSMDIQVDGGVGPSTIHVCAHAGSNVIVAGSAIFGAPDSKKVISELRSVVDDALKKAGNDQ